MFFIFERISFINVDFPESDFPVNIKGIDIDNRFFVNSFMSIVDLVWIKKVPIEILFFKFSSMLFSSSG